MVNSPLIRPYLLGGGTPGNWTYCIPPQGDMLNNKNGRGKFTWLGRSHCFVGTTLVRRGNSISQIENIIFKTYQHRREYLSSPITGHLLSVNRAVNRPLEKFSVKLRHLCSSEIPSTKEAIDLTGVLVASDHVLWGGIIIALKTSSQRQIDWKKGKC